MAQEKFHVQCKLSREDGEAVIYRTRYIPERFAVLGKYIGIDDDPDTCHTWLVIETYGRLSSAEVNERSQDYKRTRKASDV